MTNYYDTVLLAIPTVFAAVTAVMLATGASVTAAVPTASLPVLLVIGHAMFVRAPTDAPVSGGAVRTTPDAPGGPVEEPAD